MFFCVYLKFPHSICFCPFPLLYFLFCLLLNVVTSVVSACIWAWCLGYSFSSLCALQIITFGNLPGHIKPLPARWHSQIKHMCIWLMAFLHFLGAHMLFFFCPMVKCRLVWKAEVKKQTNKTKKKKSISYISLLFCSLKAFSTFFIFLNLSNKGLFQ